MPCLHSSCIRAAHCKQDMDSTLYLTKMLMRHLFLGIVSEPLVSNICRKSKFE